MNPRPPDLFYPSSILHIRSIARRSIIYIQTGGLLMKQGSRITTALKL